MNTLESAMTTAVLLAVAAVTLLATLGSAFSAGWL
jgi:hypothetical protein